MDKLNTRYLDIHDYFYSHFHPKMSNKEILKLYEKVREDILSMWDITLVNDLYSFTSFFLFFCNLYPYH